MDNSGYHDCPCGTCFEIAIGCDPDGTPHMCNACEPMGCEPGGECQVDPPDNWECELCGQHIDDGKPCGCGAR